MTSEDGDATTRFVTIKHAAEAGSPKAQFQLAEMYQAGIGCKRDSAAAFRWFLRSAEQEFPAAEYELAFVYLLGSGVTRSNKEAGYYLLRASNRGVPDAQFALGVLLANGRIFKRSLEQARRWLRAAQAAGHKDAAVELQKLAKIPKPGKSEEVVAVIPRRVLQWSSTTDPSALPLSERERSLSYGQGLKSGRVCAAQGLAAYKRKMAGRNRPPNDFGLLRALDAVHELSLELAMKRGYLDPDCADGIEDV
jgi:TPR repeat protein